MATIILAKGGDWSDNTVFGPWPSPYTPPSSADDVVTPAATNLTSITIATSKFNLNSHGLNDGDQIVLATTGALPIGINPRITPYFVVNKTANDFQLSLTSGGTAVTLSGSQSGTHSFNKRFTLTLDTTGLICKTITLGSGWKLTASVTANSELTVQNTATFQIGSELNIDMSSTAIYSCTIKLNGAATGAAWYGMTCDYGMIACKLIGFERTRWTRLNGGISVGAESATVDLATGWKAGDILVLGSTAAYDGTTKVDIITLDSNYAGGTTISWDNAFSGSGPTTYAHADNCYVGNLWSNMIITSADTSATSKYAKGITINTRYNASERTNCPTGSKVLRDVAFYKVAPNQYNYPALGIASNSGSGGRYSIGAIERCAFSYHANYCFTTSYQDPYAEIPFDDNIFYTPNTSSWRYDISLGNSNLAGRAWSRNVHFACGANGAVIAVGNSTAELVDCVSMCAGAFLANSSNAGNLKATRVSMLSSRYSTGSHGLGRFEYVDCDWGTEFGAANALGAGHYLLQYGSEVIISGGIFQTGILIDETYLRTIGFPQLTCLIQNKDNDASLQYLYQRSGNVTRDESVKQNGDASLRFEPKILAETFYYTFDVLVPPSTTLVLKGNTRRDTATTNFSVIATLAGVVVDSFTHSAAINTWDSFSLSLSHASAVAQNIKIEIECSDSSVVTGKAYLDGIPDYPFVNKVRWYGYNYDETSKTRVVNAAISETTESVAYAYVGTLFSVNTGTAPILTSVALLADCSFAELYDGTQAWARANNSYNVPATASVVGMLTAQCDITTTGYSLSGLGSVLLGGNILTASIPWNYVYTGGTFSQTTDTPSFSGGTLTIGAEAIYIFSASSLIIELTPSTAGVTYDLTGGTFSGTIYLKNLTAHAIFVSKEADPVFDTSLNIGGTITLVAPTINQAVVLGGLSTTCRIQLYDTDAAVELYNDEPGLTSFTWNDPAVASADRPIRLRITDYLGSTAKVMIERNIGTCGTTESTASISFNNEFEEDLNYNSHAAALGITGADVTDIEIDDSTNTVKFNFLSGGDYDARRIYMHMVYWLDTEVGIRDDFVFCSPLDPVNLPMTGVLFENVTSPQEIITFINAYVYDATTGRAKDLIVGDGINFAPDHVVQVIATVGGVNIITGDIADVPTAAEVAAEIVANKETLTVSSFLGLQQE